MRDVWALVCKPTISVGEVTSKSGAAITADELGCLLTPQGNILGKPRKWSAREVGKKGLEREDIGEEVGVPWMSRRPQEPNEREKTLDERHGVASKGRMHPHVEAGGGELPERRRCRLRLLRQGSPKNDGGGGPAHTDVCRNGSGKPWRDDYSTSFMTAFLQSLAWQRIIHRSDNEFSLLALLTRVAMNLPCTEHGFASQSESLKDTQGRWARWNSGLADGLNRQTRLACQGEQCSVMVARWTREEEGGRPWRRLQVEFNVPKVGDQAQALVATCGPTVRCALETTSAVELRCSRQLMRSTRVIRQLVCDATTCFCRRARDYFGTFQPERHASASGGQGRRGCRRGSVFLRWQHHHKKCETM